MTYNPSIPTATQRISQSQQPLQDNFTSLDNLYNQDHVKFDDATVANRGYHRKVTFIAALGGDPNFVAPISCLYTKGGTPQLYFQNGNLSSNVAQITGPVSRTSGEGFMPGGLQVRSGSRSGPGSSIAVSFSSNFPTAAVAAFAISNSSSRTWNVSNLTTSGFTANASSALGPGDSFYFFAIGY